ncbi:MAG TPA: hypothetical protein VHZ26_06305 [Caulobacteraceae bacterium]|jgi:hypothetical protein|nr:hypothetical protein [Caulobacteraceae bacterium]
MAEAELARFIDRHTIEFVRTYPRSRALFELIDIYSAHVRATRPHA